MIRATLSRHPDDRDMVQIKSYPRYSDGKGKRKPTVWALVHIDFVLVDDGLREAMENNKEIEINIISVGEFY